MEIKLVYVITFHKYSGFEAYVLWYRTLKDNLRTSIHLTMYFITYKVILLTKAFPYVV